MTVPAGWYPDPQDQNALRYWDGAMWTDHRAPVHGGDGGMRTGQGHQPGQGAQPGQVPAGQPGQQVYGSAPAPGTADQTTPYDPAQVAAAGGTPDAGAWGQLPGSPASTGTPGHAPPMGGPEGPSAGGQRGPSTGGYGAYGPAAAPPSSGTKTGLFVVLGVAVLVIVLVVVFAVRLISGLGGAATDPVATPSTGQPTQSDPTDSDPTDTATPDEPADAPTADGGSFVPGDTVEVQVPEGGGATYTFVVDEPGVYWLDTFSEPGEADPIIEVASADGTQWRDDDGSTESDNSYDASLTMTLTPGEHEVRLTDYSGDEVTFELRSGGAEAETVEPGTHEFSAPEGGSWLAQIPVSTDQTVSVDVHDTDEDSIASVMVPDGTYEENDDRSSSAPDGENLDPYIDLTSPVDGMALVTIWGYSNGPVNGSVTITVE
ncbi:DUF2510 domain-containing protein [Ruania halotolerans]|uniref:DUF2510 domain-containing protein n=1 Tax=Ruania halotolerans TaxID=2897773 RepID=UPI001E5CDE15|nr:DUF2510 domain-containing protein [Ruania halotolerans]UFU08216.1 DUF2510 domain-containing protein [Ruania halotolerans]